MQILTSLWTLILWTIPCHLWFIRPTWKIIWWFIHTKSIAKPFCKNWICNECYSCCTWLWAKIAVYLFQRFLKGTCINVYLLPIMIIKPTVSWVRMVALICLRLPTHPHLPSPPSWPPTPIDSIHDITGIEKTHIKISSIK